MHIGFGQNTVSSLYGHQKGDHMKTIGFSHKKHKANESQEKMTVTSGKDVCRKIGHSDEVDGEKTFYTAETPKVYQIFTTDNMLWTGGNGTGLSYCLKYADDSTDENPVVLAKGVDENGKEFEQRIYINDVNPSNATVVEMRALEAHYKVEKQGGFTSLPLEAGNMGLNDRRDFISMFKECIEDLNKLGRFDLSLLWTKSMDAYLDLTSANSKYK